jgi:uncharacterized protein YerC
MMPHLPNLKLNAEKLKNALAAVLGRAIATVKRFSSVLHNRCNLVVYVDSQGRTCCQFLRRDAFTGYSFDFSGDKCIVTNKESGDVYTVNLDRCSCPAFKYAPKQQCKHQRMVAELRGELTIEQAVAECNHPRAITGLDAHFCPDCRKSIEYGTPAYNVVLQRTKEIDPNNVPKGCILKRSEDWTCMEFDVHVTAIERQKGVPTPALKNIGRLVQHGDGIYTYRVTSGIARTFQTTRDAIAYLVKVVGTSFEEIAQACEQRDQLMRKRIARL